ncbi:hypothetical protein SOVF_211440 [Spinacia oleracea]|nr:hypothetical protein SOVF_211440 [Spinacia oleracea]
MSLGSTDASSSLVYEIEEIEPGFHSVLHVCWEKAEAESVDEVNKKSEERAARDVRYFSFAAHSRPTICLFYFLYLF